MRFIDRLIGLLIEHRAVVGAVVLVFSVAAAAVAVNVPFEFTPQAIFAGADDLVSFAEEHKQRFGYEDTLLVVALRSDGAEDVLTPDAMNWQIEFAERAAEIPGVEKVHSLATLQTVQYRFGTGLIDVRLIGEEPMDEDTSDLIRRRVDKFKLLEGALISEERDLTAILLITDPADRTNERAEQLTRATRDLFEQFPPPEGYEVHLSGLPVLRSDIVRDLQADVLRLFPMAAGMFLVVLLLLFRRPAIVATALASVGTGVVWMLACMVLVGQEFNLLSNILPTLILIIGISNSVHILGRFDEECHRHPGDSARVAHATMIHMSRVCLLTLVTTAVGFGSLLVARSHMLKDFAWQAAIGMICLLASMVIIFCVLLPRAGRGWRGRSFNRRRSPLGRISYYCGMLSARRPLVAVTVLTILIASSLWAAREVIANSTALETYDDHHQQTKVVRMLEEKLSGIMPLEVSLEADNDRAFHDIENYNKIADVCRSAKQMDGVTMVRSYVGLYQEIYAQFRRRPQMRDEYPQQDEAGHTRMRITTRLVNDQADVTHLHAFMTPDRRRARILIRLADIGTHRTIGVIRELEAKLAETFPPGSDISFRLTGDAYLNSIAMDRFVRDLFGSLLCAIVLIFVVISVLFRSIRIGAIAVFPNLVPLVCTYGYIGLRGYDLNAGNVIVFAISLGIGVDDTIHFLARFREEMRSRDFDSALRRTLLGTGRAIVVTSLLVISGLAVLMFSEFVPTRRFAELTAVTMLGALGGVHLLLPPCLSLFWEGRR